MRSPPLRGEAGSGPGPLPHPRGDTGQQNRKTVHIPGPGQEQSLQEARLPAMKYTESTDPLIKTVHTNCASPLEGCPPAGCTAGRHRIPEYPHWLGGVSAPRHKLPSHGWRQATCFHTMEEGSTQSSGRMETDPGSGPTQLVPASCSKVSLSPSVRTSIPSAVMLPRRISSASGSSRCRSMARRNGRAPYWGS